MFVIVVWGKGDASCCDCSFCFMRINAWASFWGVVACVCCCLLLCLSLFNCICVCLWFV